MGKKGYKTVKGTSIDDVYNKILDIYLQQELSKAVLYGKRKSKAQIVEDAILLLLAQRGTLEQVLEAAGVPDVEVQRTIQRLRAEYDLEPRA